MKIGDIFECPEGHKAKIVWISEEKNIVAVRCPQEHLRKVVKAADHAEPTLSRRNQPMKERRIYVKDMVFLININR